MKTRYILAIAGSLLLLLALFSTVGEPQCTDQGVYTIGDVAGVAFTIFAWTFMALGIGYTLGHDDGERERRGF